jgi:hypothetical protein
MRGLGNERLALAKMFVDADLYRAPETALHRFVLTETPKPVSSSRHAGYAPGSLTLPNC